RQIETTLQANEGNNKDPGQTNPQRLPVIETTDATTVIPNVEQQILQEPPLVEVQRDDLNDLVLEDVNVVANNNDVEAEGKDSQQLE
ncbi:hypothetical protein A2U01_0071382, partial [Trifolium medium]|nr:hypothetical protein [Trifolium medium]